MHPTITLRQAERHDMDWINQWYTDIRFVLSDFDNEKLFVAEVDGQPAALGRLVEIPENAQELGGIYVHPDFRSLGLARKIVQRIVDEHNPDKTLYCLPFHPMQDFYKSFGFRDVAPNEAIPEKLKKKLEWCHQSYPHHTYMLVFER
jgi:N-acetylglutamate synthase-like GNAT family acetyltransferase